MDNSTGNESNKGLFPTAGVERSVIVLMLCLAAIVVFFLVIVGLGTVEDNGNLRGRADGTAGEQQIEPFETDVIPIPD